MKSEPTVYAIDDLTRDRVTLWEGVRNYQVRNFFRDVMRVGDCAFFYHSNCTPPGIVGEMEVSRVTVVDPLQFDPQSEYYDSRSTVENPRWLAPEVTFKVRYPNVVSLQTLQAMECMQTSPLVGKGNRLSVVPLTNEQYIAIQKVAGIQQ